MESSSVRPITADNLLLLVDQTVRLMARGYTPDELADLVAELLPRLRDHPWLGEFYGTVKQTVRQVYSNYFGWFECDPTNLDPLPHRERSARYVAAMGDRDAVIAAAEQANADGDYRWAAEILTHVLREDPDVQRARQLKADALRQLGYQVSDPIWRNFYLMAARELDGTLDYPGLLATLRAFRNPDVTSTIPILLGALATWLDPAKSEGLQITVSLRTTDRDATCGLAIRSDIAEVLADAPPNATIDVQTTESTLRGLLTGQISWQRAAEDGAVTLNRGTAEDAAQFWNLFDPPPGELQAIAQR